MDTEQIRKQRELYRRGAIWMKRYKPYVLEGIGHLSEYLDYERRKNQKRIAQRKMDVLLAEKALENYREKVLMEVALDYASK